MKILTVQAGTPMTVKEIGSPWQHGELLHLSPLSSGYATVTKILKLKRAKLWNQTPQCSKSPPGKSQENLLVVA
jgi:hypothetical protein